MRARVGDLAIVRFDPSGDDIKAGRKYNENVGLVIGTSVSGPKKFRSCKFIYWTHGTRSSDIVENELPSNRLIRARPVNDDWEGTLFNLTLDNVVAIE